MCPSTPVLCYSLTGIQLFLSHQITAPGLAALLTHTNETHFSNLDNRTSSSLVEHQNIVELFVWFFFPFTFLSWNKFRYTKHCWDTWENPYLLPSFFVRIPAFPLNTVSWGGSGIGLQTICQFSSSELMSLFSSLLFESLYVHITLFGPTHHPSLVFVCCSLKHR